MRITAVGDVMLGARTLSYGFGIKEIINKKGIEYLFNDVNNYFSNSDIIFGNLECPISKQCKSVNDNYRADPEVLNFLKTRFTILSVANNHIMEHGESAFWSTVKSIEENGIIPVGIRDQLKIIKIKNCRIGLIGFSCIDDEIDTPPYFRIKNTDEIFPYINEIRESVDIIIVSAHWGSEYTSYPSPKQIEFGRKLIDNGADLILGHHAHVIQGYEYYKGKLIIYGLGNFLFDHTYIKSTRTSAIAHIDIDKTDIKLNFIPITFDLNEYFPTILHGKDGEMITRYIEQIRNSIENVSISEYIKSIGNYQEIKKLHKYQAKGDMKLHFIKNIFRYPLRHTIEIGKGYLIKK